MIVLRITDLEVLNQPGGRLVPRRYSIDGITFQVEMSERILIVGGPAAGKDTLSGAILAKRIGVSVMEGYELAQLPEDPESRLSPNIIYIKNNFHTRYYPQESNRDVITDPNSINHWKMIQSAKSAKVTVLAFSEIDKLDLQVGDKINEFTRIIVIDEGRIVADNASPHFKGALEYWIKEYAKKRYVALQQDCKMLRDRFLLDIHEDWLN
jgi:ABC-type glutathione transport system ATPase component